MKGQDNPLIPNPHPHLPNSTLKKPIIVPSSYQPKKTYKPRKTTRTTKISQSSRSINLVAYETVYKEWEDKMERAVTTASSLDAEQDSGNINRIQSMATLNESFPQGTDSGSGPRFGEQKEKRVVMANLDFCDTHNMVAFLNKLKGSKGFQQIVDFLNTSHIKFSLTKNPTIYTSLIQQFWQTASTNTLKDGEVEITATIDGQLKTITEASLRRHLKLEDANGITLVTPTKTSTQEDHPEDQLGVLSVAKVLTDVARIHTYSRRRRTVSTGSGGVSTAKITSLSRASKDKGKDVITESESEQTASKLKERQERAGYEATIKLQEHLDQEES
ncbi:hypothetical protein Tco_0720362 [Tanacetum coccineum]